MHGGLNENFHKTFKEHYMLTYKLLHSGILETLDTQGEREIRYNAQKLRSIRHNGRKIAVVRGDGEYLVRAGPPNNI